MQIGDGTKGIEGFSTSPIITCQKPVTKVELFFITEGPSYLISELHVLQIGSSVIFIGGIKSFLAGVGLIDAFGLLTAFGLLIAFGLLTAFGLLIAFGLLTAFGELELSFTVRPSTRETWGVFKTWCNLVEMITVTFVKVSKGFEFKVEILPY